MGYRMVLSMFLADPSGSKDDLIFHIIDRMWDVNYRNCDGQTPLHKAVGRPSINVARKLIKNGANINAQDNNGSTPLHEAVCCNNIEAICMLLYYGADVHILNENKFSPFVQGLDNGIYEQKHNLEMATWLLNYYDTFSGRFARMTIYQKLFRNPNAEDKMLLVIRHIWNKFDYTMYRDKSLFLSLYLLESLFSIPKWLNCLYSLLNTPDAAELMTFKFGLLDSYSVSHFSDVFCFLLTRNVRPDERLPVIALWLSFGAQIYTNDVIRAFKYYGVNEELMFMIYSTPVPLITLIFALEEHFSSNFHTTVIFQFICGVRQARTFKMAMELICKCLEFFSWDPITRLMIINQLDETEDCMKVIRILEKLPKMPSLVELSRNLIVEIIQTNVRQGTKKMLSPLRFHEAVRNLNLTQHAKDILHFKKPLYL